MHRIVVAALLMFACAQVSARPTFGGGLGFELRIQREVNPDYAEAKGTPQLFAQMSFVNWGAHLESSLEKQSTSSGGLSVSSRSYNLGAWARYKFLAEKRWRPFASAGLGSFFDKVTSDFGAASNDSSGTRPYAGLGGGLAVVFWNHLVLESEARVTMVRERKEPMFSALLRVGFLF